MKTQAQGQLSFLDSTLKPRFEIPLTQGKIATVSPEAYHYISQWRWHARKEGNVWYAYRRHRREDGSNAMIAMHREVFRLHFGRDALMVDHRDRNGLNNELSNLREANHQQNGWNRGPNSRNKCQLKGVAYCKGLALPWSVTIQVNGKRKKVGSFGSAEAAAIAYDKAAIDIYGRDYALSFMWLNTIQGGLKCEELLA